MGTTISGYSERGRRQHSSGPPETLKILLGGKTGSGKSSTVNSLLGILRCKTGFGSRSETYKCQLETCRWRDHSVEIMDTPGLFDTKKSHEEIAEKVVDALFKLRPGADVFLYIANVACRTTEEEANTFKRLIQYYGEGILKHTILVFTHGDLLEQDGLTLSQYVEGGHLSEEMQIVLKKCGGRHVLMDNKAQGFEKQRYVDDLMEMVLQLSRDNHGRCYENDFPADTARRLEKLKEILRKAEEEELKKKKHVQELKRQKLEAEEKGKREELAKLRAEEAARAAEERRRQEEQEKLQAQDAALRAEEGREREERARRQAEEEAQRAGERLEQGMRARSEEEKKAREAECRRAEEEGRRLKSEQEFYFRELEDKSRREEKERAELELAKAKDDRDDAVKVAAAAEAEVKAIKRREMLDKAKAKRKDAQALRDAVKTRCWLAVPTLFLSLITTTDMIKKAEQLEQEAADLEEEVLSL